ncbi:MAG TPA: leucyl aminopeptidase [Longimicrobiales bacterium]
MAKFEIQVIDGKAAGVAAPMLVLPHFEGTAGPSGAAAEVDARMGGVIAAVLGRGDFKGKRDEALVLYPRAGEIGAERLLLVGLGKAGDATAESVRRALGTAVRQAERLGAAGLALPVDAFDGVRERLSGEVVAQAAAEGAVLAAWDYREFKTAAPDEAPRTVVASLTLLARDGAERAAVEASARRGAIVARGENLARELASSPGNVTTPSRLAEVAERIAREHGMELTVLDREAMRREGMGALLAVAQGSEEEPRFIVLEYRGGDGGDGPLVLVGKGVTFDTGGISIKPAAGMEEMKFDMSGAAAVLGAMQAIAELRLPAHVVALIPSTENMPSGRAIKPGDIIRSHAGKTIEVVNTDAEGRLILADALSYAQRFRPRAIVDAATLTGACVVALGHVAIGLMGSDEALVEELRAAGERTGERCWPLPLWDEYRRQLDSEYADLKNTGGRPAGTITGGWFLKEFAGEAPWAHLDIAGTAYGDSPPPYLRKGSTGVPTRLFVDWVQERAGR